MTIRKTIIFLGASLVLVLVIISLLSQLPITDWSSKIPSTMTTTPSAPGGTEITNNTSMPRTLFLEAKELIRFLRYKNTSKWINNSLIEPLIISMIYYYKWQKLYEQFGGHGLVPLRSFTPFESEYFNPYSLEVSEYAAEIPYLYAWLYWITGNETYLELAKYSVDAVKYWSTDHLLLGGCWGSTDPIVYDKKTGRYVVRWKLVTWYTQTQLSWWDEEWFKQVVYDSWNYTLWYDPIYDWYWFTPWEVVYYGPPGEMTRYKEAFMGFVHAWINHDERYNVEPYAYIVPPSELTPVRASRIEDDAAVISYSPLTTRNAELMLTKPIELKGNAAYSFVIRLRRISGDINVTIIVSNGRRNYKLVFPRLPESEDTINITLGSIFLPEKRGGDYKITIIVSPQTARQVKLEIYSLGVVATPNMGLYGLTPSYMYWGDSIGPLAAALIHYYPGLRDKVTMIVKRLLDELDTWGTDKSFYPPDTRWKFYYWSSGNNRAQVLTIPGRSQIHYASLEETTESIIPLIILTGDNELLNSLWSIASRLNHTNYWLGLGYWSAWFGIWTHLWLYAVTGDDWFLEEASHYIGIRKPFDESLDEEVSNAAKFIEANIVAYYLTGDEKYIDLAREMANILLDKYVDPYNGYIRVYTDDPAIARHDMLAWTASPLLSLYLDVWVPDWMLWLYPLAVSDDGRPNGFFTLVNVTYTPNGIIVWNTSRDEFFIFKYNGYIVVNNGIEYMRSTPTDYYPYVAEIGVSHWDGPRLIGFNNTEGSFTVVNTANRLIISSSTSRIWIILLDRHNITSVIIDGNRGVEGKDYEVIGDYLIIAGSIVEVQYD